MAAVSENANSIVFSLMEIGNKKIGEKNKRLKCSLSNDIKTPPKPCRDSGMGGACTADSLVLEQLVNFALSALLCRYVCNRD
jgi:hypothetical protein